IAKFSMRATHALVARILRTGRSLAFANLGALVVVLCAVPASDALVAPFRQQGTRLVGAGDVGNAFQGFAVALSGDGNSAIVGGLGDNSGVGAAWVFTREKATWRQQGQKLVGAGGTAPTEQGFSVALSADGNTAIVGGFRAAWVFTRTGSA